VRPPERYVRKRHDDRDITIAGRLIVASCVMTALALALLVFSIVAFP
jgi:hypothetical protein